MSLTVPSPNLIGGGARRRARLLSVLLLFQIGVGVLLLLVQPVVKTTSLPTLNYIIMLAVLFVSYILSRSKHYIWSVVLYIGLVFAIVFVAFFSYPTATPEQWLSYLVVAVLFSSMLLSLRATAIITVIVIASVSILLFLPLERAYTFYNPLTQILIMSALILTTAFIRNRDLFHIKRQKQQLTESENRYCSLMEATLEAIMVHKEGKVKEGIVIDVNHAFERTFGHTLDEVVGRKTFDFFAAESQDTIQENYEQNLEIPYEVIALRKDGTRFDAELHTREHIYGGRPVRVTAIRDITERRQAERIRREEELRYRALFEQTNDAIFIFVMDGHLLTMNKQATNMIGYEIDEVVGKTLGGIVPEREQHKSFDVIDRLLAGEKLPVYERIFRKKDGTEFPVEINVALVRDADGNPLHVQSIARDISGRKRAQQHELDLAIERERVQILRKFVSDASHDFGTPITNLKTSLFLLKQWAGEPDKQQKHLDNFELQITRLERLLADLLTMVRLEIDSVKSMREIDVNLLLREVVDGKKIQTESQGQSIELHLSDQLPAIMADKVLFEQAVGNLVENAVNYNSEGGAVTVRSYQRGELIAIEVEDTGVGISDEDLPHIFDSFYRGDAARGASTGGTGVGLSIVCRIVQSHSGTIEVQSTPGEGSIFTVLIPPAGEDNSQGE